MKCEICGKEILRDSQCINYKYYHNDCIENLQQENERLKENNMSYQEEMAKTWKIADDYKSRFEKAKEYINENKDKYYQDWGQDDSSVDTYLGEYEIKELLDILNEVQE